MTTKPTRRRYKGKRSMPVTAHWGANAFRDDAAKSMTGILAEADFLVKAATQQFVRGSMHRPLFNEKVLEVKSAVQQALDEYAWAICNSDDRCQVACLGLRDRLARMRRGQHGEDDESSSGEE
jgi:hypothetical protein